MQWLHTEKSFRNIIKSTRNRIVLTIYVWFRSKRTSVWIHIIRKMVNTIWFRVDLIIFRKDFSVKRESEKITLFFSFEYCWCKPKIRLYLSFSDWLGTKKGIPFGVKSIGIGYITIKTCYDSINVMIFLNVGKWVFVASFDKKKSLIQAGKTTLGIKRDQLIVPLKPLGQS